MVCCYEPSQVVGIGRRPNHWTKTEEGVDAQQMHGTPCSTRELCRGGRTITSEVGDTPREDATMDILGVLRSWGGLWMWEDLTLIGDVVWLLDTIEEWRYIAVTNGLFMRNLFPYLGAAAFVLECTKGRG